MSDPLPGPPGPKLQKLNAFLHQEPFSTIAYGMYWSYVLFFGAPLVGIVVWLMIIYELILRFIWGRRRIKPKSGSQELAVVVTGCDSGFGKELVFRLASEGFVVFAGCLKEESFKHFALEPMIRPLVLDVTSDHQVQESFKVVLKWLEASGDPKKNRYLHALVNNAGVGRLACIDWTELSDFHIQMEVNFYGQVRMVKAFLPIFKQQAMDRTYMDSQLVNMISVAGMLSGAGFGATAYEASKHAAEAFTNALRLEMKTFGVKVVAVNPSFHATPMLENIPEKLRKEIWDPLCPDLKKEYGEEFFDKFSAEVDKKSKLAQWDMQVVIDSMTNAILSSQPPAKILVGLDARFLLMCIRMMPPWAQHYIVKLGMPHQLPACMLSKGGAKSE